MIITGILLSGYMLVSFSFFLFQDRIVFQPDKLDRDYSFQFHSSFEEFFITMDDGVELNALLFRSPEPAEGLILYFHGNADNLQRWGNYAEDFTVLGYDVLMMDYRGYGKSGGRPGEAIYYSDARTIFEWAQTEFDYNHLVIYGRSLGSAVASHLAVQTKADLLILETPFDELWGTVNPIVRVMFHYIPRKYTFSNKNTLPHITCRTLIIHGTSDWVVPLSSALQLKPLLKKSDEFVIIEGGGHNDLREYEQYHKAVSDFLEREGS